MLSVLDGVTWMMMMMLVSETISRAHLPTFHPSHFHSPAPSRLASNRGHPSTSPVSEQSEK